PGGPEAPGDFARSPAGLWWCSLVLLVFIVIVIVIIVVVFFEPEGEVEDHLPGFDLAIFHIAAMLLDLEPLHMAEGPAGAGNGVFDGVFKAGGRGADDLDLAVNGVNHGQSFHLGGHSRRELQSPYYASPRLIVPFSAGYSDGLAGPPDFAVWPNRIFRASSDFRRFSSTIS